MNLKVRFQSFLAILLVVILSLPTYSIKGKAEEKPATAEWWNFRNSAENMAITSADTPTTATNAALRWSKKMGSGWTSAPSVQIIVDNSLVLMSGSKIYKLSLENGDILTENTMVGAPSYGYTPPIYAENMIFVPLSNGRVQAFDAKTLKSLWVFQDSLKGQALSPITYDQGYIYTGFWNSETKDANYVCISVKDEDTEEEQEQKESLWSYTSAGGFYWAGAYVTGDTIFFGTDDGTTSANNPSHVYALHKTTGKVIDSIDIIGDQRSSIAYDKETASIYFTTKAGYLYSIKINEDGTFQKETRKELKIGSQTTSTPVVYKGRLYVGVCDSGNAFGGGTYKIAVIDANKLEMIYGAPLKGYPQCSVLLSHAQEEKEGYVYVYTTYNNNPGGITVIKDQAGQTEPIVEELFTPDAPMKQYCITSLICDEAGTLYYKNDSAYIMAVENASYQLVEKEIAALPTVEQFTLKEEGQVQAARKSYAALSAIQKNKVSVQAADKLEALEKRAKELHEIEIPVVTTAPAITTGPVITTAPAITTTPAITTAPAITTPPTITARPIVPYRPVWTKEPSITTAPVVTKEPLLPSIVPVVPSAPSISAIPAISTVPAITGVPAISTAPAITTAPAISTAPAITGVPEISTPPAITIIPDIATPPIATSIPTATPEVVLKEDKVPSKALLQAVQVTPKKKTVYVGMTSQIKVALPKGISKKQVAITYKTSKKSIATVSKSGKISAKKKGTVKITTTIKLGSIKKVVTTKYKIKNPTLKIITKVKRVKVGEKITFQAKAFGLKKTIYWSVNKKSLAKLDKKKGTFLAKKKGKVKVTAKCGKLKAILHVLLEK